MAVNTPETSAQVLVVEDEAEIRELISLLLLRQGHRVQQCASALEALESLKKNKYDLMVLDWMLPQMSGIELLKTLDQEAASKIPVLMVTAKAEPENIVQGLEAGADDYITKPFEPAIFSARVKALLRRSSAQKSAEDSEQKEINIGPLSLNTETYEVKLSGEVVHLTPSEFKILSTMASSQGKVLTRDHLISVVQGDGISVTGRTIDTHVFGLRKKMGEASDWIETIRGVGYRVKQNDRP
jgi:two-component system, OmpR family, phosphate regulon response regulator PhoB